MWGTPSQHSKRVFRCPQHVLYTRVLPYHWLRFAKGQGAPRGFATLSFMESTLAGWRLDLLGPGRLVAASTQVMPVAAKALVVLAYLALEGATSRTRLADLLWPEVAEVTARNNLVQLLRRTRQQLGVELVQGSDPVALSPALTVDTRTLSELYLLGGYDEAVIQAGPLLQSLEVQPGSDLAGWLQAQRERLDEQRLAVLRREAVRFV